MENMIAIMFFDVFPIFPIARSIKSMKHGYSLDEELNFTSNEYSCSKLERNLKELS